jgi:Transcriptional regulator, AbiEi antitoxin/AbiEi antitoxin C-terminal domain/Protein of unknown function (DUF559)
MTHDVPVTSRLAGVVTTAELEQAGITDAKIRVLVRRGALTSLGRGVYARNELADQISERTLRLAAALAIVGPRAIASHYDAALIHGLALLDRPPASVSSVSHPRGLPGGRARRPGVRVHLVSLPSDQVTTANGVPVTTVARTVVDLARTTRFTAGVVAADSALYRRKTSKAELAAVIATSRRWPGIERARQVVDFSDARSESPFESISRVAFRDGRLPPPELQVWVGGDEGPVGRVDFLWRAHRTIAEADGALKYADPDRARQQLRRDADLRAAGFEVVHFSWAELTAAPDQVILAIKAAFRRADALRAAERPASRPA